MLSKLQTGLRFYRLTRSNSCVSAYNRSVSRVVDQLLHSQIRVAKTSSFDLERPDAELRRLSGTGTVMAITKGIYALVPEGNRGTSSAWRPTLEGAALGIAAALHTPDMVALTGPSAARALGCYPRALGVGYVSVPKQRRKRETPWGTIRFVERDIDKLDTVRVETDLGAGWTTSPEQTALDLCRSRPDWQISDEARNEMIRHLAARIDWGLIDEIARETRGVKTLQRLRSQLDTPQT